MPKTKFLLILFLFTSIYISSCKKDDDGMVIEDCQKNQNGELILRFNQPGLDHSIYAYNDLGYASFRHVYKGTKDLIFLLPCGKFDLNISSFHQNGITTYTQYNNLIISTCSSQEFVVN